MLSTTHIQRLFDAGDNCRMIDCLAQNGAALPLPLKARLAHPAAAVGMGLRRLSELAYGPTALSRDMTHRLLLDQQTNGAFPGASEQDPLATAAAAAGLAAALREQSAVADPSLEMALDRALSALSTMQDAEGLFIHSDDRTEEDRALTSAFVLFLLARLPHFRESIRFAELMTWFEERLDRLEPETTELYHMASLDDPTRQIDSPQLAAIAA